MTAADLHRYLSGPPSAVPCNRLSDGDLLRLARVWPAFANHLETTNTKGKNDE